MNVEGSNIGITGITPPPQEARQQQWEGLTLDQLRMRRAMALVRREMGRERINAVIGGIKTDVSNNGIRSFLFKPGTVKALKWTDYVLLGFNTFRLVSKLWRK